MEGPECPAYEYVVDEHDELVSVSDAWIGFARENSAPELTRSLVLGKPIWDFVAGAETRELYRHLFASVRRDGAPRLVPFRCDSPGLYRFMELRLVPTKRAGIELSGVLLREQVRVYSAILDRALKKAVYSFPACSLCNRIFAFGSWLEVEDAVRRLGAFDTTEPPALEHTVCETCRSLVERESARPSAS